MPNNLVVKRVCVLAEMRLAAPALIGGTDSVESDRDVALDKGGNPLVPGTTLAGILRAALNDDDANKLFGRRVERKGDDIKQSPVWVYDAEIFGENGSPATIITIDNVSLDENNRNGDGQADGYLDHFNKVAKDKAKFDMQAVEKGSVFHLRLRLDMRENDDGLAEAFDRLLTTLNGLYVGGKTSRGFGKLACDGVYLRTFDFTGADKREQTTAWLAFSDWGALIDERYKARDIACAEPPRISTLKAALRVDGSVLIRDVYSIEGDEDHAHTKSAGASVIYGTSWAGALRGGLAKLLKSNGFEGAEAFLDDVFGRQYHDGTKEITSPSKIRIDASYIDGGGRITVTRNKIDRFTGGAADTALFTNRPHFGGTCALSVQFPKGDKAIQELLLLAVDALDKGLITVGGEVSVGRGVFRLADSVLIDGVAVDCGKARPALKEVLARV